MLIEEGKLRCEGKHVIIMQGIEKKRRRISNVEDNAFNQKMLITAPAINSVNKLEPYK